jgi:radical SAM protein with 4Fe4S-binding SPASM domain
MNLYLQPDVALIAEDARLGLMRDGVPVFHTLGVGEAVALACLAATGSCEEATRICSECLPDGARWVSRVIDRYWTYLGEGPPRKLDFNWIARVARARPKFTILPQSNVRKEAAPAAVTWMVTLGCNRHCPYCFYDVFYHPDHAASPADATFLLPDVVRMIREMSRIGCADLYLTGGEPLLRRDLPEIISEATCVRVRTHLVTKYSIDRLLAGRLASAGLTDITVSLDDSREREAGWLAGVPGYLNYAKESIASLLEAGLAPEVNAVVTAWNADHMVELADLLVHMGVPQLKISRFNPPYPARVAAEPLGTQASIPDLAADLRQRFGDRIRIKVDLSSMTDGSSGVKCGEYMVCEVGTRALDVLPDGSVTRCHYLPWRKDLVAGSLQTSTLLDIWNSSALNALTRPPREAYAGESCQTCDSFEGCHSRGRCYVSALIRTDKLFAPDTFCTAES